MIILISIYSSVYTQQNQIKKKAKTKTKQKNTESLSIIHAYSKHNPIQYQKFWVHLGTAPITYRKWNTKKGPVLHAYTDWVPYTKSN